MQTIAAGAGVGALHMAFMHQAQLLPGLFQVFAGAATGIGQTGCAQLLQRVGIVCVALGLPDWRFVRGQAALSELLQDDLVGPCHAAWRVNVFDAHQPGAVVGTCVQPAGQGRDQRACMQGACGRRCKAPTVGTGQ